MKNLLFVLLMALTMTCSFTSCGSDDNNDTATMSDAQKIIGSWTCTSGDIKDRYYITFNTDGTMVQTSLSDASVTVTYDYTMSGQWIKLTSRASGKYSAYNAYFDGGDKLTLKFTWDSESSLLDGTYVRR